MTPPVPEPVQTPARVGTAGGPPLPSGRRRWRIFLFYSSAMLLTGLVSMLFADLLWRTGWSASRTALLGLFIVLFFLIAVGATHGVFGFCARRLGDRQRITRLADYKSSGIADANTALLFPVFNENVTRVCEGLRATYQSLQAAGQLDRFDFFILSDSNNADQWVEEERRWCGLIRELDALGRIYYRRRISNEGKKSGNVRDFLSTWGKRYRYFMVLDADSVMRGDTIVDLVKLMEANPGTGLIQTVPATVNAESFFGRTQQFANRLYAPMFIEGLNFWAQELGNYWGHNAIIRTEPFMHCCDLPQLPGRKPFGGYILSHDFVEAALLVREDWQAWFVCELGGSYEEAPQTLIENARRDRRWCQGNMQHSMVLCARGLRDASRWHLALGILGYLSGPLWLLFLLTFDWTRAFHAYTGLSDITVHAFTPYLTLSGPKHALLIFLICMFLLLLPKALALMDLAFDKPRRRAFGGLLNATGGVLAETLFSTLHAPLQMLWHTQFVVTSLLGHSVKWTAQERTAAGTTWSTAIRCHWIHTTVGLVWGGLEWWLDRRMFWWFVPVFAGMALSVPLSVLTSRRAWGERARRGGLFLTPEETSPPPELAALSARLAARTTDDENLAQARDSGITDAVADPYVNAIHVSLLRERMCHPVHVEALAKLGVQPSAITALADKLLTAGPDALKPPEKLLLLSDADAMAWLHRQLWLRPGDHLAAWWQAAIRRYAR